MKENFLSFWRTVFGRKTLSLPLSVSVFVIFLFSLSVVASHLQYFVVVKIWNGFIIIFTLEKKLLRTFPLQNVFRLSIKSEILFSKISGFYLQFEVRVSVSRAGYVSDSSTDDVTVLKLSWRFFHFIFVKINRIQKGKNLQPTRVCSNVNTLDNLLNFLVPEHFFSSWASKFQVFIIWSDKYFIFNVNFPSVLSKWDYLKYQPYFWS